VAVSIAGLPTASVRAAVAPEKPGAERIPILLDLDIGTDIDDTFALAWAVLCPELDLRGVTTVSGNTRERAQMVCRLLTAAGRRDVPVAMGRPDEPKQDLRGHQVQYVRHPIVVFDRMSKPVAQPAVEFLYEKLKAEPGRLTLVAVGPESNLARLLTEHPDCKPWIRRIVVMGGSVRVGYANKPPIQAEFNIRADAQAAKTVFESGVPLTVAPLDATTMLKLDPAMLSRLFSSETPLVQQVRTLWQLWDQPSAPVMYDPVAVTLCFTERFCTMEDLRLEVDEKGFTRTVEGKPNARVAVGIEADEYLKFFVERFAANPRELKIRPPVNLSSLVERTGLPNRVHVFEDYETDIERRWWLSGKPETKDVPPGSVRACRSVLTNDFDDRQGDQSTMFSAVVFNPVPGPPMGKQPRLSFRYRLRGTDTLRVQIYSLTNGYHRHLMLTGLPQDRWESGTVDMTAARKPDGTGGPLSEGERIDDIQFYVDPRAEVLIDDVVLYDAAGPDERSPFPARFVFDGWFDTGAFGKEWPGTYAIVPEKGRFGKAAAAVPDPETGRPHLRISFRGRRPLGATTRIVLHAKTTGTDAFRLQLVDGGTALGPPVEVKGLVPGEWTAKRLDVPLAPAASNAPRFADALRIDLPQGAEILLDDVLVFEPGKP
jgi:inosine-uridine nucleoside N-ribohydrolase